MQVLDNLQFVANCLSTSAANLAKINERVDREEHMRCLSTAFTTLHRGILALERGDLRINGEKIKPTLKGITRKLIDVHSLLGQRGIKLKEVRQHSREAETDLTSMYAGMVEHMDGVKDSLKIEPIKGFSNLDQYMQDWADKQAGITAPIATTADPFGYDPTMPGKLSKTIENKITEMVEKYTKHPPHILQRLRARDTDWEPFRSDIFATFDRGLRNLPEDGRGKVTSVYPGYLFVDQLIVAITSDIDPWGNQRYLRRTAKVHKQEVDPSGSDLITTTQRVKIGSERMPQQTMIDMIIHTLEHQTGKRYVDIGGEALRPVAARARHGLTFVWLPEESLVHKHGISTPTYLSFPDVTPPKQTAHRMKAKAMPVTPTATESEIERRIAPLQKKLTETEQFLFETSRSTGMMEKAVGSANLVLNAATRELGAIPPNHPERVQKVEAAQRKIEEARIKRDLLLNGDPAKKPGSPLGMGFNKLRRLKEDYQALKADLEEQIAEERTRTKADPEFQMPLKQLSIHELGKELDRRADEANRERLQRIVTNESDIKICTKNIGLMEIRFNHAQVELEMAQGQLRTAEQSGDAARIEQARQIVTNAKQVIELLNEGDPSKPPNTKEGAGLVRMRELVMDYRKEIQQLNKEIDDTREKIRLEMLQELKAKRKARK